MARSSSSRSSARRPWWLVIVLAVATWAYNRYVQPPKRDTTSRTTTRTTPGSRDRSYSHPRGSTRKPTKDTMEGGRLVTDTVERISDGDTVKLRKTGTVRLVGVDTPEKAQPGGPEATAFTKRVLEGQTVQVELCPKQPTDRYGRGLGFIYITDRRGKRVLFNSELVRQGYARVYSLRPCTVDEELWNSYYEEARVARRGLFGLLGDVPDAASYRRTKREK